MARAGILDCLEAGLSASGIRLYAGPHGQTEDLRPARLLHLAGLAAERFRSSGVEVGDRVVTLLRTGRPVLQAILGAWAAGAVISVVAPSVEGGRSSLSPKRLAEMLTQLRPKAIVAATGDSGNIAQVASALGIRLLNASDLPSRGETPTARTPNRGCRPDGGGNLVSGLRQR